MSVTHDPTAEKPAHLPAIHVVGPKGEISGICFNRALKNLGLIAVPVVAAAIISFGGWLIDVKSTLEEVVNNQKHEIALRESRAETVDREISEVKRRIDRIEERRGI